MIRAREAAREITNMMNIIDACNVSDHVANIASKAKSCGSDTAKMYAVYLLATELGMEEKQIVRATKITKHLVHSALNRFKACGLLNDKNERIAPSVSAVRSITNHGLRCIAAVESIGDSVFSIYDIVDITGLNYNTVRPALLGFARAGIIARIGCGGSRARDKRIVVYFPTTTAKKIFARYVCPECGNRFAIYYPKLFLSGAVITDNNVSCFICGDTHNPAVLWVEEAMSYV